LLLAITLAVLGMVSPVLAPVLAVVVTPEALRTRLVVAVIRIRPALLALPPSAAFALALRQATEALLRTLRTRLKSSLAACAPTSLGLPHPAHPS
jgi:hypothetical protein